MCCSCNQFGARVCATVIESGQLPVAGSVLALIRDAIVGDGELGVVHGEAVGAYLPRTIVQQAMDYACSLEADCDSIQPWSHASGRIRYADAHPFAFNTYWCVDANTNTNFTLCSALYN